MKISVPELSVVVLVGASGCGKSTFARRHFKPTEVLSSDFCRALVADNENDQSATPDAFDILYYIARKRLAAARLTVIDATNVKAEDRKSLVELAREHNVLAVAIVFDLPASVCQERNRSRPDLWSTRNPAADGPLASFSAHIKARRISPCIRSVIARRNRSGRD